MKKVRYPVYRIYIMAFLLSCALFQPLWGQSNLSYEELVEMAVNYGLDTKGHRLILEERLREILSVETLPRADRPAAGDTLAAIEGADSGAYLQNDESSELELQGNVRVVVTDDTFSATHTISADLILYNQDLSQLSAQGNVEYILVGDDREDHFSGDRLLFLLNDSETLFFDGAGRNEGTAASEATSHLQQLKSSGAIEYYYTGEFISRNQDNLIIMDEGAITSSTDPSPNYHLRFKKIWILSPGEWGVEDLVLYVGNIPLFALPFIYLPGNEIVFHPVIVFDDIRGLGITSTTYLAGQKETESNLFSFLQLNSNPGAIGYSPMGIFLQPDSNPEPPSPAAEAFESAKLYADIYSIRGFYLGIGFDARSTDVVDSRGLFLLALTRELYDRGNDEVTSQYNSDTNEPRSVWHETTIGDLKIPLRFILDFDFSLKLESFKLGIKLPIYSDPLIQNEFSTRSEDIPWDDLLFGTSTGTTTFSPNSSMTWNLDVSLSPTVDDFVKPLVNSFSISTLSSQFVWSTKRAMDLPPEHTSAIHSPHRTFYIPKNVQLPSGVVSLSGDILKFPFTRPPSRESSDSDLEEEDVVEDAVPENIASFYIPTTEEGEQEPDDSSSSPPSSLFIPPSISLSTSARPLGDPFKYSLSYSFSNRHYLAMFFDSIEEDDYKIVYSSFEDTITASLSQKITLLQSLLDLQTKFDYRGAFREPFGFSDILPETTRESIVTRSRTQAKQNISMANNATVNLLAPLHTDLKLSLTYGLSLKLLEVLTTPDGSIREHTFEWDKDYVTTHQLGASFTLPLFDNVLKQQFTFNYVLPPKEEGIKTDYSLTLSLGPLTSSLGFKAKSVNEILTPSDLSFTLNLKILDQFTLNGRFSWLLENDVDPQRYDFGLNFFWYKASLGFENVQELELNSARTAWVRGTNEDFRLSTMEHRLDIPIKLVDEGSVEFNSTISARWNHDFVRFTSSRLTFGFSFTLLFPEFLFLRFSVNSANDHIYRYFPDYNAQLGLENKNFFTDLLQSFNFFDNSEREESNFKLSTISAELVHDLGDWLLRLEYQWRPTFITVNGVSEYKLENKIGFFLQWLPIGELNNEIDIEIIDDEWTVEY